MPTAVAPRGKTIDFLVGAQSTFGTPATGNYTKTYIRSHSLIMKQPFANDPVLGLPRTNNRDVTAPAPGLITLAGNIVVPLDYNHIGVWLAAAFGAATNSGSADPYTHIFTSGGETLPFLTGEVEIQMPADGPIFMQYGSLLVSKFTLDASRAAGEEKMTFDMMGQVEAQNSASAGGTPATPWARDMVQAAIGAFNVNGEPAANILKISATYDNKPKAQEYLGNSTGLISGIDLDGDVDVLRHPAIALPRHHDVCARHSADGLRGHHPLLARIGSPGAVRCTEHATGAGGRRNPRSCWYRADVHVPLRAKLFGADAHHDLEKPGADLRHRPLGAERELPCWFLVFKILPPSRFRSAREHRSGCGRRPSWKSSAPAPMSFH